MELFKHQTDALDNTADKNRVAYYYDMGLGKTYIGAEKMIRLGAKSNLVICQKSKINDWVNHFIENYDLDVFDLTKAKGIEFMFNNIELGLPVIGVINYDLVWRRKKLSELKDFTLMLDESSLIQHDTSNRTKFIMNKLAPANVILLSGTPTGGKYEQLLTQLHLLGWNISEDLFWNQYIDWEWMELDGYYQKHALGYKNVDRLKRKMRQHGCLFLKTDEVMDLPKQIDTTVLVEQTKEYKSFKKHKYVVVEDVELMGDTTLNDMLYQRQLCGQYNENKLKAFQDLVESTTDRLVVFYNFNDELDKMMLIAAKCERPFGVVNGKVKNPEMLSAESAILFVQYQAGSMGLNLQKANKIIYFTPPLSSEFFEQSKKRIHRIGQDKPCFYYYLKCKGSIEERIYNTLAMRRDYTDELFIEEEK